MGKKLDSYASIARAFSAILDVLKQLSPYVGSVIVAALAYLTQWGYIPIVLFALAALVLLIFARRLLRASPSEGDGSMSDASKGPAGNVYVTSHNQSGGITAQNVHINPKSQRVMGDVMKQELLREIPRNKRVVVWSSNGSQESHVLATEIFLFLKVNGFQVFGDGAYQQVWPIPLHGVQLREEGDNYNVEVGIPDGTELPKQV